MKFLNRYINLFLVGFYLLVAIILISFGLWLYNDKYTFYLVDKEISIFVGNTHQVEILPKYADKKDNINYNWSSSDNNIASVDQYGNVKAISSGSIKIKINSKKGFNSQILLVNVLNEQIEKLELDSEIVLNISNTVKLKPVINGNTSFVDNFTYSSNNERVAEVDNNGNVTANTLGEAIITVTSSNGMVAYCKIIVVENEIKVEKISISDNNVELNINDQYHLNAIVYPENATNKKLYWYSDNSSIVSVDGNGNITAKSKGTTNIYVKTNNNNIAKCKVTVKGTEDNNNNNEVEIINPTSITLNYESINLINGDNANLVATISPENVKNKTISWSTTDDSIVSVNNGAIFAKKNGVATIVAMTENGLTASCVVNVSNKEIKIESINLNQDKVTLKVGDKISLIVSVNPANATLPTTIWSSSNNSVANVNEFGQVTALSAGNAKITVKTADGKTATCDIEVQKNVVMAESISLDKSNINLYVGDSYSLTASILPNNTTDKSITWSSSNSSIASVDSNGKVTAKSLGSVIITAKTVNGKVANTTINVVSKIVVAESISLNKTNINLYVGDSYSLVANISPNNTTDKSITWSSSNNNVVTVNNNGIITAKAKGTAKITAKTSNGKVASVNVSVDVKTINVESISLNKTNVNLYVGDSYTLVANILPTNATDKSIAWSSSNNNVVNVDSNGIITAKGAGNAVITAETSNGKKVTSTITVSKKVVQLLKDTNFNNGFKMINNFNPSVEYTVYDCAFCQNNQYYFIYNANNAPNLTKYYSENGNKFISAQQSDGSNDKLIVVKNNEVVMDINTYGKTYSPVGNTWPHLLITSAQDSLNGLRNQKILKKSLTDEEQTYYYFGQNNIIFNVDLKLNSYNKGNPINGIQAAQFLAYLEVYCRADECIDSNGNSKLFWFGFNLFDDRADWQHGDYLWDEQTKTTVTLLSTPSIYTNGTIFNNGNFVYNSWRNVNVNITDKIYEMIDNINRSGNYSKTLTADDFWFGGFNIGYEIHGEYWISMSFRNLSLTSTRK